MKISRNVWTCIFSRFLFSIEIFFNQEKKYMADHKFRGKRILERLCASLLSIWPSTRDDFRAWTDPRFAWPLYLGLFYSHSTMYMCVHRPSVIVSLFVNRKPIKLIVICTMTRGSLLIFRFACCHSLIRYAVEIYSAEGRSF